MPAPTTALNPLSRRPRQRRLVVAVRGAAGVGKSVFAASLADAGLGRLCFFDTERKARLMPGSGGQRFDALEIEHPDELPQFIDWALGPEGQAQGYGCYALDSWAMYFGRKHRDIVAAVRARSGDPTAQPTADELASDQIVLQEVLRRLCVDAGACVVITDQIAAKGREAREENEHGSVVPMTASGLEYFVDVMIEMALRLDGFETVRVARVVKSNSDAFPVGLELANPTFRMLLDRLDADAPMDAPLALAQAPEPEFAAEPVVAAPVVSGLDALLARADAFGVGREALATAARHYCGVAHLGALTAAQIADLAGRLDARYGAPAADATRRAPDRSATDRGPSDREPSGDGAASAPPRGPSPSTGASRARSRPAA